MLARVRSAMFGARGATQNSSCTTVTACTGGFNDHRLGGVERRGMRGPALKLIQMQQIGQSVGPG